MMRHKMLAHNNKANLVRSKKSAHMELRRALVRVTVSLLEITVRSTETTPGGNMMERKVRRASLLVVRMRWFAA